MSTSPETAQITCPHCGAANDAATQYCQNCGMALPTNTPQPEEAPPTAQYRQRTRYVPTDAAQEPTRRYAAAILPDDEDAGAAVTAPTPARTLPPATQKGAANVAPTAPSQSILVPNVSREQRGVNIPMLAVIAAIVILVGIVGLGALGSAGPARSLFIPPTTTPIAVSALLMQAADKMAGLKTLHYTMNANFNNVGAANPVAMSLQGDVIFPDRYTMTSPGAGDLVVIGQDAWTRASSGERWIPTPASQVALPSTNPIALSHFARYNSGAVLQTDSMSGTLRLYSLNFTIDGAALTAGEGQAAQEFALSGANSAANAIVGATDSLVRELTISTNDDQNSSAKIHIQFSDFDKPVTIEPPSEP